jgi:hypothetical protein
MDILKKLNEHIYDLEIDIKAKETKINNLVNKNFNSINTEYTIKFNKSKEENLKLLNKLEQIKNNYNEKLYILENTIMTMGFTIEQLQEDIEEKNKQIKKIHKNITIQNQLEDITNKFNIIMSELNDKKKWWLW